MAKFDDFETNYEPLVLPIAGKKYTLPVVAAIDKLKYEAALAGGEDAEPFTDEDFRKMLLGDTYQQMVDDGVSVEAIRRAELTALANVRTGREVAAMMWATGGDPKANEQYLKNLVAESTPSNSTAADVKTPSPVSTSSTKSRKAASKKQPSPSAGG